MAKSSREDLRQLRNALLDLHKTLIHNQKRGYEKKYGRIESRLKLYELVTDHPEFSWIRQLSELIVGIDELLDSRKPLQPANIRSLLKYTRKLLTTSHVKTKFEKEYHQAIQLNPSVTIAHAAVMQLLRKIME